MVQYIYQKYNALYSSGYYYIPWGPSSTTTVSSGYSTSGYHSYTLNSNGQITYSDGATIGTTFGGTVYSGGSSSITETSLSGTTKTTRSGSVYYSSGYYYQGTLIGQVVAEDGTYPVNGRHTDGFYYVRRVVATPPVLLSPNGGEVFNATETITWQIPRAGLKYKIEISKDNGLTWTTLVAETAVDATSYTRDFTNDSESSLVKIRISGIDGNLFTQSDESAGVFSILHNVAPTAPTSLSPSSTIIDRLKTNKFSWKHNDQNPNDTQSQVSIRWRKQGTTTWNNVTLNNNPAQEYFFFENTFPLGQIEWQVMTYDQSGLASPYSNIAIFTSAEPTAAPNITQPGQVVNVALPVIEWTGGNQLTYQIIVEDALGVSLWDTGEITSPIKARTSAFNFVNGSTYKIKLRIKDTGGLFSSFSEKTVTVSYTPPVKPVVETSLTKSGITLNIGNPTPTGTQPATIENEIYKIVEGNWIRIATGDLSNLTDYAVASEELVEYRVVAKGENGTISQSDVVSVRAPKLNGVWLHDVQDPEMTIYQFKYAGDANENYQIEHAFQKFAGRTKRTIESGPYLEYDVSIKLQLLKRENDRKKLIEFVKSLPTLLYRDWRGRKFYTSLPVLSLDDVFYGNTVTVSLSEIEYDEEV